MDNLTIHLVLHESKTNRLVAETIERIFSDGLKLKDACEMTIENFQEIELDFGELDKLSMEKNLLELVDEQVNKLINELYGETIRTVKK